ncbi:MAG: hypothetical protein K6G44_10880 [Lentisphaeria bacterium]|nr:hypothetical protein [Lentisphaeria bacterium]
MIDLKKVIHAENGAVAANNINAPVEIHNEHIQNCIGEDEVWEKINNTDFEDWSYNDDNGIYICKKDIALTIQHKRTEEIVCFDEPWVTKFEDPNASKELFQVQYNCNFIKEFFCVLVDGARMFIPLPKTPSRLTISYQQYKLGKIINICHRDSFDRYIQMAGISIKM